jgi:hypothetical protein
MVLFPLQSVCVSPGLEVCMRRFNNPADVIKRRVRALDIRGAGVALQLTRTTILSLFSYHTTSHMINQA